MTILYTTDGVSRLWLLFFARAKGVKWIDDTKEKKSDRVWDDNLLVSKLFMHVSNSWENFWTTSISHSFIAFLLTVSEDLIEIGMFNCEFRVTIKELYPNFSHQCTKIEFSELVQNSEHLLILLFYEMVF